MLIPRWSVKKNSIEFLSVLDLVLIPILLGLCTRVLCSHDLLEGSTLITNWGHLTGLFIVWESIVIVIP